MDDTAAIILSHHHAYKVSVRLRWRGRKDQYITVWVGRPNRYIFHRYDSNVAISLAWLESWDSPFTVNSHISLCVRMWEDRKRNNMSAAARRNTLTNYTSRTYYNYMTKTRRPIVLSIVYTMTSSSQTYTYKVYDEYSAVYNFKWNNYTMILRLLAMIRTLEINWTEIKKETLPTPFDSFEYSMRRTASTPVISCSSYWNSMDSVNLFVQYTQLYLSFPRYYTHNNFSRLPKCLCRATGE